MERMIIVQFDDTPVRMTSAGLVSVLDAIKAVTKSDRPAEIWEELKKEHPGQLPDYEDYRFREHDETPVVDADGWEQVALILFNHLVEHGTW
jgi:hypothetical protein